MKTQKTMWARMCEGAARLFMAGGAAGPPAPGMRERPLPDVEGNDRTLAHLPADDPVYRALMDHAFVVFENNTAQSMTGSDPVARLNASDRAAGVLEFVNQVESTRARLQSEMLRRAGGKK